VCSTTSQPSSAIRSTSAAHALRYSSLPRALNSLKKYSQTIIQTSVCSVATTRTAEHCSRERSLSFWDCLFARHFGEPFFLFQFHVLTKYLRSWAEGLRVISVFSPAYSSNGTGQLLQANQGYSPILCLDCGHTRIVLAKIANCVGHFVGPVNHQTFVFDHFLQHRHSLGRPSEVLHLSRTFIEPHSCLLKSCATFRFMTCLQKCIHHVLEETASSPCKSTFSISTQRCIRPVVLSLMFTPLSVATGVWARRGYKIELKLFSLPWRRSWGHCSPTREVSGRTEFGVRLSKFR
jgi:hypothetical protein